jgi:hypothetical protein
VCSHELWITGTVLLAKAIAVMHADIAQLGMYREFIPLDFASTAFCVQKAILTSSLTPYSTMAPILSATIAVGMAASAVAFVAPSSFSGAQLTRAVAARR